MPSLSSVAAEVLANKFRDEAEHLRKVREAASASEDVSSGTKVLRVLERLAKLPVTPEVLKETGVGKEVNDRFVRRHVDSIVREKSKDLVASWKARVAAAAAEAAEQAEAAQEKEARKAARAAMESEKEASRALLTAADGASRAADAAAAAATDSAKVLAGEEAPIGSPGAAASPVTATSASPEKRKAEEDGGNDVAKMAKVEGDVGPNEAIAALFKELSDFEFKKKETKFKAIAYKKVAARLRGHPEQIRSGREASKLEDIGEASRQKIDEFLSTGKIEKLEKYRRGEFD